MEPCCLLRKKIVTAVIGVRPAEDCGVSDVELADIVQFVPALTHLPVIVMRFCPWCGVRNTLSPSEIGVVQGSINEEGELVFSEETADEPDETWNAEAEAEDAESAE